ncbi:MAG: hypothetical protein GC159_05415 [Phycisphaera sp.]|nr:hypothetical protein [Phycisphaera sp.]
MSKSDTKTTYLICINNTGYEASLEPRKLYAVMPDQTATQHGRVRVIDESGEDYLFPQELFLPIAVTATIATALKPRYSDCSTRRTT